MVHLSVHCKQKWKMQLYIIGGICISRLFVEGTAQSICGGLDQKSLEWEKNFLPFHCDQLMIVDDSCTKDVFDDWGHEEGGGDEGCSQHHEGQGSAGEETGVVGS